MVHTVTYIDTTGVLEKLDLPVNYHGLDATAFLARACGAINKFTGQTWVSGDFLAMRTAEYLGASLYAYANNFTEQAEQLRQRAVVLFDLLCSKPHWRN